MLVLDRNLLFFPILSALYIISLFYMFRKKTKNLSILIPVSVFSFVDNSLCVSQEKSYNKSNAVLYYSYSIISSFFSLTIKHWQIKGFFYFFRLKNIINPSPLDLKPTGSTILRPKNTWQYLGFFLSKKLSFWYVRHSLY